MESKQDCKSRCKTWVWCDVTAQNEALQGFQRGRTRLCTHRPALRGMLSSWPGRWLLRAGCPGGTRVCRERKQREEEQEWLSPEKSLTQIPVDFEQCLLPSSDRGSPMASAAPHVFRPATPQNHPQPHPLMQFPASGHRSRPSGCLAVDFDLLWIRPYAPQRLLLPPRLSSASKVIFYSRSPGGGAQRGWREPGPFCFAN